MRCLTVCVVLAATVCAAQAFSEDGELKIPPFKGEATAPGTGQDGQPVDVSKLSMKELQALKARNKLLAEIAKTLQAAKNPTGGKASPEDIFLVGKVEMTLASRDAKVEFETLQGLENATKALADFVTSTPPATGRYYRAFARFSDATTAAAGLSEIRQRFDAAQEYQQRLMAIYQANSMCRS